MMEKQFAGHAVRHQAKQQDQRPDENNQPAESAIMCTRDPAVNHFFLNPIQLRFHVLQQAGKISAMMEIEPERHHQVTEMFFSEVMLKQVKRFLDGHAAPDSG